MSIDNLKSDTFIILEICSGVEKKQAGTLNVSKNRYLTENEAASRLRSQRPKNREHQDRDGIQHDLIGCQEAERETKLMQKLPVEGGQLEGEALRAWLAVGLQYGVVPGNHDRVERQDEQC
jgi:hypothetical protein